MSALENLGRISRVYAETAQQYEQLREQVAVGRSYVTSERALDQFHADRVTGAA